MSTIGDDLLRPASADFGPEIEAVVVYNSNPVAVAPQSRKVVEGFQREDLFTVVLEHFLTDTADHADYVLPATTQLEHLDVHTSYGHTYALINELAIAPLGQASPTRRSSASWQRAWALPTHVSRQRRGDGARRVQPECVDFHALRAQAGPSRRCPTRPSPTAAFPRRAARCWPMRRSGRARLRAELRKPRVSARAGPALPAGDDLAAGAQLPQLQLRQRGEPARHRRRAAAGNARRRRRPRATSPMARVLRVFNDRGSYRCAPRQRARGPGVVIGLDIWWRKLGLDGSNVNELTHQALTDIGRAPTSTTAWSRSRRLAVRVLRRLWLMAGLGVIGTALLAAGALCLGTGCRRPGLLPRSRSAVTST